MAPMPRPRKPYVNRETSRHGKTVWYFRKGDGPRTRLKGDYESPEWLAGYEAALATSAGAPAPAKPGADTVGWLIDRYMDSSVAFASRAANTQRMRASILRRVKETAGKIPLSRVTSKMIAEGRDARSATPAAAVNFVKVMIALFKWAVEAGHMTSNPAVGVEHKAIKTDGHHTWTVDEVRAYYKRHPVGTRARLAIDILLFTGMRAGDAVEFGRQHVRGDVIRYRSQKTGVDVTMPLLPPLKTSIEKSPTGELIFLSTERGQPFKSPNSFGNWFRKQCVAAGVPGRAHGLRKAGATLAAENGTTDQELMALWGWLSPEEATVYTRRASRAKLAQAAGMKLLEAHSENILSPHLDPTSPAPDENA